MELLLPLFVAQTAGQPNLFVWTASLQAFPIAIAQSIHNITTSPPTVLKGGITRDIRDAANSSKAEMIFLGALLLVIVFFALGGSVRRPKPIILLAACLSNLQTAHAEPGRLSPASRTMRENRRVGSAAARGPSLSSELESFVLNLFLLLFLISVAACLDLGLRSVALVLAIIIPLLPVAFALKALASMGPTEQEAWNNDLAPSPDFSTTSTWIVILPLVVLIYSVARRPRNAKFYLIACLTTISLGIAQSKLATRQSLEPLLLSRTINIAIVASHLALWFLHLVDTIENYPILEALFTALFGFAALMALLAQDSFLYSHSVQTFNTTIANITAH
jgi:hypothetical protein